MPTTQAGKPVSPRDELVAAIRPKDAEPTATNAETALIIVDEAGRMLVDQNGDLIVSRWGSVI